MRYGTLDENGRPVYFTGTIYVDGKPVSNPSREMMLAQGKKPFMEAARAPKSSREGLHFERDGWTEQAKAIVPKWKLVEDAPPPPRVFSKLKCVAALMRENVWPRVKQYIEQAGLYDLYLAAQEFSEDNEYFVQGKAALQQALGWTDEQVEAVLAAAEVGAA